MLTLRTASGDVDIPVALFAPEQDAAGGWSCRYDIGWPDRPRHVIAGGFDIPCRR